MTTKIKTELLSSTINQKDVNAIETAYSHWLKYKLEGKGNPLAIMFEAADTEELRRTDQAAFAFVAAKHGYTPDGKLLPGFTGTVDPEWPNPSIA